MIGMIMNTLKSNTTQNVGAAAAVVLVIEAVARRYAPDLSETLGPELFDALRVLVLAVVTTVAARGLAFWRSPQKRS